MAKFWTSKAFKELNRDWDRRLANAGFEDAEEYGTSKRFLKEYSNDRFLRRGRGGQEKTKLTVEASYRYFQAITEFVAKEEEFSDEFDKLIMERTGEGKKIREISEELKNLLPLDRKRSKYDRNTIRYVRRRYEHKWGLKTWKAEQMVSRKVRTK